MSGTQNAQDTGAETQAENETGMPEIEIIPAHEESAGGTSANAQSNEGDEELGQRARRKPSDPRKRINDLTREKYSAQREAAQLRAEADNLRRQLQQANGAQVQLFAQGLDAQIDKAEQDLRAAVAEADVDGQVNAQKRIAELSAAKMVAATTPPPQMQPATPSGPPREIAQWIDEHPWFRWNNGQPDRSDPATDTVVSAHERALRRGIRVGTPEYFEFVDGAVKREFPDLYTGDDEDDQTEQAQPQRTQRQAARPTAPAAQVRRAAPMQTHTPTTRMRLTEAQVEAARIAGVTPQAYAAAMLRQQQKG